MAVATSQRPAALASLKEVPVSKLVQEGNGTYCTLHGKQPGLNCSECDKHYPDAVKQRELDAAPLSMGILPADVQKMIDEAVKAAIEQQTAFYAWKSSPEGQAAAAVAKTANVVPPDHATPVAGETSTPVPAGSSVPTLAQWVEAGYPEAEYESFVARFSKPVA